MRPHYWRRTTLEACNAGGLQAGMGSAIKLCLQIGGRRSAWTVRMGKALARWLMDRLAVGRTACMDNTASNTLQHCQWLLTGLSPQVSGTITQQAGSHAPLALPLPLKRSSQSHRCLLFFILIELLYLWWSRENDFPFHKTRGAPNPFRQHPGGISPSGVLKW